MVNILTQLQTIENLSNNEKIVANYILENPGKVLTFNSKELAQNCFVSVTTIYRLCDKLGVSGYSQLKVRIANVYTEYLNNKSELNVNYPVQNHQTPYEVMGRIKETYYHAIEDTYNLFSIQQITMIAQAMKKAKQIDIYTSAGNMYFAQNFQFQMAEIGVNVQCKVDEYEQRLMASSSDKNHLAILISFGGRGYIANAIPQILNKVKCPIVLISSNEYQPPYKPKYQLYFSNSEHHSNKISSYSTRLSLLYVLDVLYTCYFELDYDLNVEKKKAYYKLLADASTYKEKS